jgi:uncharacterized protein YgiM (DUF1202 family)
MKTKILLATLMLTLAHLACASQPLATPVPSPTAVLPASETSTAIPAPATALATQTAFVPSATLPPSGVPAFTATAQAPVTGMYNPYAVVLVLPGDILNIRAGAGVGNSVVGTLQPTALGVNRTGPAASAGGDRWVEIQNPGGGTGWVNSNFLTEHVTASTFCGDTRVTGLLNSVRSALLNSDGDLLSSLVSPAHGLDVRLWRYGTVANYSPEEAEWVFQSEYQVSWGAAPGSGAETVGSFSAQPLPKLQEVFGASYSTHCNDTLDLATFNVQPWPPEYSNINFYTIYKAGTEQYGGLDWRAWTVGVEYVQGKPTLFALIHYQWEP